LEIAAFPDSTLEVLGGLINLTHLRIMHLPKINSLIPLVKLINLQYLSLSTLPSWDASRKVQMVDSLLPICELPNLMHLELFGVCDKTKSLRDIYKCQNLKTARFSRFKKGEVERICEEMNIEIGFNPKPFFQ